MALRGCKRFLRLEGTGTRCRFICTSGTLSREVTEESKWRNITIDQNSPTGFEDTKTFHLLRAAFVQRLCSIDYFVENSLKLMNSTRKVIGHRLFTRIMDMTFYGHFCVGADLKETTTNMLSQNIRPMILITVEEEAQEKNDIKSREKWYRDNKNLILHSIQQCHSTQRGKRPRFVHFRLTGFMPSSVLTKVSTFLSERRNNSPQDAQFPVAAADLSNFQSLLKHDGEFVDILSVDELNQIKTGLQHFQDICEEAEKKGVFMLVDAEYTSFNPGIRVVTNYMKLSFNQQQPLVQHTFQAYLKKSYNEIKESIQFCRHHKICFGTKIVRGAYMVSERQLAKQYGKEDPVFSNKEATNKSYDECVSYVIHSLKSEEVNRGHLMVACHNEESINLAIDTMRTLQIEPQEGLVTFGQTYGLSDYITKWLGKNGYVVFKSTPIGSVYDTLPYLYRRAHENKAAMDFRKDKLLVERELRRRF